MTDDELAAELTAWCEQHSTDLREGGIPMELPVVSGWVLVVAWADAATPRSHSLTRFGPPTMPAAMERGMLFMSLFDQEWEQP